MSSESIEYTPLDRVISVGGLTKAELLDALQREAILINPIGEQLFASAHFITSDSPYDIHIVELTVAELGFAQGTTLAEIYAGAAARGLALCPVELGPHLRLQYSDQPEGYWGQPERPQQAPPGSITVASAPLSDDDDAPKGFYLRRIKGELWLRGYRSGDDHIWASDDHFVFCLREE